MENTNSKRIGRKYLVKKSYGQNCVFWALLHVKNFEFFNFDLNLHFTLGNSKSSMGNSIAGRIWQKYFEKKKL